MFSAAVGDAVDFVGLGHSAGAISVQTTSVAPRPSASAMALSRAARNPNVVQMLPQTLKLWMSLRTSQSATFFSNATFTLPV